VSKYVFPDLTAHVVLFKGRRYISFAISKSNPFKSMEEYAEFVVWDGLYDAAVSYGSFYENGSCKGFLAFSHVEIEVNAASSINDFVKNSSRAQLQFFKDIEGH